MKRFLAAFLCLLFLLPASACSEKGADTVTTAEAPLPSESKPQEVETAPPTGEEAKTEERIEYNEHVDTPLTPELLATIPIAREGMTTDELRQICVDYVKLSVSFQWLPSKSFSYVTTSMGQEVNFYEGKLYGGLPYVNVASGNLYRALEMYDSETGVMNVNGFANNSENKLYFGTACSGTTGWGWSRVINSAVCAWTAQLNANAGLIPVGPYTYDLSTFRFGEDGKEDCNTIVKRNGKQVMFESYAMTKMADCFVNRGHVRMNGKDPVVVRNEDGTINGEKSYIVQVEQGFYTNGANHKRVSAGGFEYDIQGNDGLNGDGSEYYFTFEDLYNTYYLPHTFKEFHGQDPIEPGEASLDLTSDTVNIDALSAAILTANYSVSDIFTVLIDSEGKELLRYPFRSDCHYDRVFKMRSVIPKAWLWQYQDKGCTVRFEVQLGNGELVTAYSGKLVP
ncbi:MAG: hypothetical protein IKC69_03320 [Clostridia bacterium]|nr:hypothetical protein [Clostridia bacterium]